MWTDWQFVAPVAFSLVISRFVTKVAGLDLIRGMSGDCPRDDVRGEADVSKVVLIVGSAAVED
jgi:hypothetical protein